MSVGLLDTSVVIDRDDPAVSTALPDEAEATFDAIAFDAAAARSYGQVVAAVVEIGRSHRRRIADLLIAATAHANGLPLYTRSPDDFAGLGKLVDVVGV
jgi:predicted nucleic acid-binding protein